MGNERESWYLGREIIEPRDISADVSIFGSFHQPDGVNFEPSILFGWLLLRIFMAEEIRGNRENQLENRYKLESIIFSLKLVRTLYF